CAVDCEISPATGACTVMLPPSGGLIRASTWPAVTLSPASAMISVTLAPSRSGRTDVSSRANTMPDTSTLLLKQYLAAFSTVTAGPRGAPSPSSPAASAGCAVSSAAVSSANSFGERSRVMQLIIGNPTGFPASSIAEQGPAAKHAGVPAGLSELVF